MMDNDFKQGNANLFLVNRKRIQRKMLHFFSLQPLKPTNSLKKMSKYVFLWMSKDLHTSLRFGNLCTNGYREQPTASTSKLFKKQWKWAVFWHQAAVKNIQEEDRSIFHTRRSDSISRQPLIRHSCLRVATQTEIIGWLHPASVLMSTRNQGKSAHTVASGSCARTNLNQAQQICDLMAFNEISSPIYVFAVKLIRNSFYMVTSKHLLSRHTLPRRSLDECG